MNDDIASLQTRFTPKEGKPVKLDRQLSAARFTACGKYLLAAGHDGLVRRLDASGDELLELKPLAGHGGWVQRVVPLPTGDVACSADSWGQLRCMSFVDEAAAPRWANVAAHAGWILDLALSPNGTLIATCGVDRAVRVWSVADGSKLHEFLAPEWEALSVTFTPDDASVLAGDLSGKVRQWELASGKITREFDASVLHKRDRLQDVGGARRLLFSPDGTQLLCGGTKPKGGGFVQGSATLLVFEAVTGQLSKTIDFGGDETGYVTDLAWHPAGFLMLTTSGQPGNGKLVFRRLTDDAAFFETTKLPNCHSVALHPSLQKLAVIATNAGSSGNGRNLAKDGTYPGNYTPIHEWTLPSPEAATPM